MHTLLIIVGGFVLLGLSIVCSRFFGVAGAATFVTAAKVFIPLWLIGAGINMWIGVSRAGYSVAEELPIFLVIFAIPAVVAVFLWWKFG